MTAQTSKNVNKIKNNYQLQFFLFKAKVKLVAAN